MASSSSANAVRLQHHLLLVLAALYCLTLSSSSVDAPSGAILTFCSGQSPYFNSPPIVTTGEFDHFLGALCSGTTNLTDDMSYTLASDNTENRTMYGIAQCRPDATDAACAACLAQASGFISAGGCSESAIWYDTCFLRYSDQDPSRFHEDEYTATVFNGSRALSHGVDGKAVVIGLLATVRNSLINSSRCSIGAGTAAGGSIYGFTRCAAGIACTDCGRCLLGALEVAEREYNGSVGMQVLRLSCMARYEGYPIYNATFLRQQLGVNPIEYDGRGSDITVGPNGSAFPPAAYHPAPAPKHGRDHPAAPPVIQGNHGRTLKRLVMLIAPIATGVAAAAIILPIWIRRKQSSGTRYVIDGMQRENMCYQGEEVSMREEENDEAMSFQLYSYQVLEAATCHFSNSNKLGSGGFGTVYRGTFEDGKEVAVKRLKDSKRNLQELEREISIMGNLRHKNLLRFLGYCFEEERRLLVYEYVPNNSLERFWFKASFDQSQKLDWATWFYIIDGVARGLRFLHDQGIIHRDLKPHNVLLDENLNPKIADFDLMRLYNKEKTHETTDKVAGTFGYMAPECTSGGKMQLSIKSDVYSYGVLVLEIITGHKINTFQGQNYESLVEYVWQHWTEKKATDVVDSDLGVDSRQEKGQALRCVHVALLCVQSDRSRRPDMGQVIAMLSSEEMELPEPSLPGYVRPKPASGVLRYVSCLRLQ